MGETDLELLARYTRQQAEDAFAEIVRRHLDLVYSAALRLVRSPQLAEEVAQSTFVSLAREAPRLAADTILPAWLYQVAHHTAANVVRGEVRRQLREKIATEMNVLNATDDDWRQIEPLLEEAMLALNDTDRAAVLLRYFENQSLRDVGAALGTTENAAQKRLSRAVDQLRDFFAQRGVATGATGLAGVLSAKAVHAAPAGLDLTISTAAAVAGSTLATTTAITASQTLAMTTLQKILVTAALVSAVGVAVYEARQVATLREENRSLAQQQAPLAGQIARLQRDQELATARIATLTDQLAAANKTPAEVQKLRGQVGVLRQEKAAIGSKSALSKITADPETRKAIREQQKMGMGAVYGDLAKRLKLPPETTAQLKDLLADSIMDNIDVITQALHDQRGRSDVDQLFSAQDSALQAKLAALLGPDGLAEYNDYSKNLASEISAAQFERNLTGDAPAIAGKKTQLTRAVQEEFQSALAAAGLPADFQTVPMLNFRNIASEEFGEQSVALMDGVFDRVATRATAFLTLEELKKWQDFRKAALENNRAALLMNRKMMAPIGN